MVAALRSDVDRAVRRARAHLRREDHTRTRRAKRDARDAAAAAPPDGPRRGGGFSEIRRLPRRRAPPLVENTFRGRCCGDRVYADVVVVRKADGMAVLRKAKFPAPPDAQPEVSRHCRYRPSNADLSALSLS